jgi:hypothetical protein
MSNVALRGGSVHIRVGGNSQEEAVMVPSLPDGRILEKDLDAVTNPVRQTRCSLFVLLLSSFSPARHKLHHCKSALISCT